MPRKNAQVMKKTVTFLGFEILWGQMKLSTERKKALCQIPEWQTVRELCAFLGMVRWWIGNYGLPVRPSCGLLKTACKDFIKWIDHTQAAFKQFKKGLMRAPALDLPDYMRSFELFTYEWQNITLGVPAGFPGEQRQAGAHLSEQLDDASQGWLSCLWAVTAMVLLTQKAPKLTPGRSMTVCVLHMVQTGLG